VSHLTTTEKSVVIWLNIVTIVARVSAFCPHTCAKMPTPLVNCMVWSILCQECRKCCFSSQHLFR